MTQTSGALGLVEAAHDGDGDWQSWCDRLLASALPLFPSQVVNIALMTRGRDRYELTAGASNLPGIVEHYRAQVREVNATEYDLFMRFPRQVGTMNSLLGPAPAPARVEEFRQMVGAPDTLGLVAITDNVTAMVGVPQTEPIQLAAAEQRLLGRVALHIEAGLRLRLYPGSEIAVLDPDGRLLHARGPLRDQAKSRLRLRQHVTAVERSRARKKRQSASAVEAWSALISGSWGLVERVVNGKRHYVIVEAQRAQRLLALSPLEAEVAELSGRGLTGKAVAYALGISNPVVSHALSSAALKLGVRSRTELVRLVAQLLGTGRLPRGTQVLTNAERDVLEMVRLGWPNAAIARARSRSERTVANQVASLLSKIGAPSRRALASVPPPALDPKAKAPSLLPGQ